MLYIEKENISYINEDSPYNSLHLQNLYNYDYSSYDLDQIKFSFNKYFSFTETITDLMPPGVKAIFPGVVIFERPPTMKLVQHTNLSVDSMDIEREYSYDSDYDTYYDEDGNSYSASDIEAIQAENQPKDYYIPIPWQLYIASFSTNSSSEYYLTSVKMFFMNSSLNSPDNNLYIPYIPNFYSNGRLCNPMLSNMDEIVRYPKNVSGVIASAYDWIWNSGFNNDLIECIHLTLSTNPNEICTEKAFRNARFSDNFVNSFYSLIEDIPLEKITSLKWANPSYYDNFSNEVYYAEESGFYTSQLKEYDNLISSLSEEDHFTFRDWIAPRIHSFEKSYKNIINYSFNNDYFYNDAKKAFLDNQSKTYDTQSLVNFMISTLSL